MVAYKSLIFAIGILLAFLSYAWIAQVPAHRRLLAENSFDAAKIDHAYELWKSKYGRLYGSPSETQYRKEVFAKNFELVESVNNQKLKYKLALNQMADMTDEEFKVRYLGLGPINEAAALHTSRRLLEEAGIINWATDDDFDFLNYVPFQKDWTEGSALNPPIHQRGCGACYAFAAAAALEHAYFLKTGQLLKFSEQELIDCSKGRGNTGCRGGWTHQAFDYVLQFGGIQRSLTYPYLGAEQQYCRQSDTLKVKDVISGYKRIPPNKPNMLKRALHKSVVTAAVDGSFLKFYASGVYENQSCGTIIDHAIVIVGYGMENDGTKFWKIRNSWGADWGQKGYFKLLRYEDESTNEGVCGITKYLVFPTN